LYEKKLASGSSPIDEDASNDMFTAKRIISLPPFVDEAFMESRRESSPAPNQLTAGSSGNQSGLVPDMALLNGDLWSILPGDGNLFDLEAQIDGGMNDLDYNWME
jgi:hypothetical protein